MMTSRVIVCRHAMHSGRGTGHGSRGDLVTSTACACTVPGMPEPADLDGYLDLLVGVDLDDKARHVARSVVMELLEQLDDAVDVTLASAHAVNAESAYFLAEEVFPRLPWLEKVRMVTELIEGDDELGDRFPFVVGVLPKVYRLRHAMAHGRLERVKGGRISITSQNRGKERVEVLDPRGLGWLVWQTQVMRSELLALSVLVVPDVDDWYGRGPG